MNLELPPAKLAKLRHLENIRAMIGPAPTLEQYNDALTKAAASVLAKIARAHLLVDQMEREVMASEQHEWSAQIASEVIILVDSVLLSRKQTKNASQPRKVPPAQRARIRQAYQGMVKAGEKYGAKKALQRQHGLSRTTIDAIIAEQD